MPCKIYIPIIAMLLAILPCKIIAQNWVSSECSGLQLRTAVYCPTDGNYMRIWGEIFNRTQGVPTVITSISDLNGNIYDENDILTPTSDIGIIIHSTLNDSACIDTIRITVAKLPQANITEGLPEPILCINTFIDEPKIDTQNVDLLRWEKVAMPIEEISFPFQVTEDMHIRLAYANSLCGSGFDYINIPLKVIDTAPVPDLYINKPYNNSNSNFPNITDVCRSCNFSLPEAKDIKVDSGIILGTALTWNMPDSTTYSDTTRYGNVTITIRGDSNICGYKSKTFTDQSIQVDIKTLDCKPVIYFGIPSGDDSICPCEIYQFGVRKPYNATAAAKCIYTEQDITKSITHTPLQQLNNPSLGSYNFRPVDSFRAYISINAELQCPAGASIPKVPITISDSIKIAVDDKQCLVPVNYRYCKGDTSYMFFMHTREKHVIGVEFLQQHDGMFCFDSLRTDNTYVVYKSIEPILDPVFWNKVQYRVSYIRNNCEDTASYDTIANLLPYSYCEPVISHQYNGCSGCPIYLSMQEVSRAVVVDSFVIKDSAEFYTIELEKDTVITTYSDIGNSWDYDISQSIQYTIRAYPRNNQDNVYLNIPIITYWRDTINGVTGQQKKNYQITNTMSNCINIERDYPQCVGEKTNITTMSFYNPGIDASKIKVVVDSTSPLINVKQLGSVLEFETVQFSKSALYKAEITYNLNDSIRKMQVSFSCNVEDCPPRFIPSKDTICSGDSMSIKVINDNVGSNVRIHHITWDSAVKTDIDSVRPDLYHSNIHIKNPPAACNVYLAVNTVGGYDTIIMYRDTLNVFVRPKPSIFTEDTIYKCQGSIINLHDYEDVSLLVEPPDYDALGEEEDPAAFVVNNPINIRINALCKYHCDEMLIGSNEFQDNIFIDMDRHVQLMPKDNMYACVNDIVPISIENNGRFVTWILNDSDTLAKNLPIKQHIYDTVTTASKKYTAIISNSCNTLPQSFYLYPNPLPEITMPQAIEACAGTTIKIAPVSCYNCSTYLWSAGSTSEEIDLPLNENSVAEYVVFTAISDSNCIKNDSVFVTPLPFAPAQIQASDSITVCLNSNTAFSANFSIKQPEYADKVVAFWSKYPASSKISVNANEVAIDSADYSVQGLYIYTTNLDGCLSRDSIFVSVLPLPALSISGQGFVCIGDTVFLLGNSPDADYLQWQGNSNYSKTLNITEAGRYSVTAYMNGCIQTASINVTSRPKPEFSIGIDTIICHKETVILSAPFKVYPNFWWQDYSRENIYTVTNTGDYYVTAEKDSCYNTDHVFVEVVYCGALRFPTAFTPNGDNFNDCFMPVNSVKKHNLVYELIIYNRLGERIFQTTNPEECWDGTFKGKPCDPAVYTFRCTAGIIFPERDVSASGTITLVR